MGEGADTQGARTALDYYAASIVRPLDGDLALIACPAMLSDWHRTMLLSLRVTGRNHVCDGLYLDSGSTSACVGSTRPNRGALQLEVLETSLVRERPSQQLAMNFAARASPPLPRSVRSWGSLELHQLTHQSPSTISHRILA